MNEDVIDSYPTLRVPATLASLFGDPVMMLLPAHIMKVSSDLASVAARIERKEIALDERAEDEDFWNSDDPYIARLRPYVVKDGVLQVPVKGVLLADFPFQFGVWATGFEYIRQTVARGAEDANVKKIAFMVDSPGGHAAECFEAAKYVTEVLRASGKPSISLCTSFACSAAYAMAVCADSVVVTDSAEVGSVGVIVTHFSFAEAFSKVGIQPTIISAGRGKSDGSALIPLSQEAKARFQERVNFFYAKFLSHVASARNMSVDAVEKAGAKTYWSKAALDIGFADKIVETLSVGYDDFRVEGGEGDEEDNGDTEMSTKIEKTEKTEKTEPAFSQADIDAARAAGAKSERDRFAAIMSLDEAKGREKSALNFAVKTDMTPEAVKELLADIPAAQSASAESGREQDRKVFEKAMSETANPGVSPTGGVSEEARADAGLRAALAAGAGRARKKG